MPAALTIGQLIVFAHSVATTVNDADLAIPAGFKESKSLR
jgi:hypothetical protein